METSNYIATEEDLSAVEEGLSYVADPELDFIFQDRSYIEDTLAATYDSKYLYYWIYNSEKNLERYQQEHEVEIDESYYRGWSAGSRRVRNFISLLPDDYQNSSVANIVSGAPLTPFVNAERGPNIYNTYESYLATIVHEFGHIYYDSVKRNRMNHGEKDYNISLMESALSVLEGNKPDSFPEVRFPTYDDITEVFAYCTDYSAATIFWPNHKADIEKEARERIPKWLESERELDYSRSRSALEDAHQSAQVVGPILIAKYGLKGWVDALLKL